jgi:hypothetical protein
MTAKITYPVKQRKKDQTGLTYAGRHEDGRYIYESLSVMRDWTHVALTHDQRVGVAVCRAIAKAMDRESRIYPMTRESGNLGYGTYGRRQLWITRPQFGSIGKAYLAGKKPVRDATFEVYGLRTFAHEMGHNEQRPGTKPHGPEFDKAHQTMRILMRKALAKGWPKLDMRKLRDSATPGVTKRKAKVRVAASKAATSTHDRWVEKLARASARVERYEQEASRVEKLLARAQRDVRKATGWAARTAG